MTKLLETQGLIATHPFDAENVEALLSQYPFVSPIALREGFALRDRSMLIVAQLPADQQADTLIDLSFMMSMAGKRKNELVVETCRDLALEYGLAELLPDGRYQLAGVTSEGAAIVASQLNWFLDQQ